MSTCCVPRTFVQDAISFFMATPEVGITVGTVLTPWELRLAQHLQLAQVELCGGRVSDGDQRPAQESDSALPPGRQWTS